MATGKKRVGPGKKTPKRPAGSAGFPIVGVGASAGGLKALEDFFAHLPGDLPMAFVVVQHLDPKHESYMVSLLERYTAMEVRQVEDGMAVEPSRVYIKPPGRDVLIENGVLRLREPVRGGRVHLPIDDFFRSLAEDQGANAIAIVLSGAGSDGSQGLRAVNGAGGLVMVQEEAQAEYHSMPASAIATGLADFVLPVEKMGRELARFASSPLLALREAKRRTPSEKAREELGSVLAAVRAVCGHDFSQYKLSTVQRRIERRMAIHQLDRMAAYARLLREKPGEAQALFQDMLINVTSFFRDAEAFDVLQAQFAELLGEKGPEAPVRVWVPGCATGEEAFSIAILLLETMDRLGKQFPVKVFATDLNRRAIEIAREGVYPDNIAADVSEMRLQRFFQKNGNQFQVTGQVRSLLVFSLHDVMRDPPFSRLDLVSCRNLLIYMDSALQKKVIPLLYYGLNPGGLLMLGSSEGVGDFSDLFTPVSQKWKIFKTREGAAERPQPYFELPIFSTPAARQEARERQGLPAEKKPAPRKEWKEGTEAGLRTLVERTILEKYAQPGVLVDERDEIVYFHGETESLLMPPKGEPNFNLLGMTRGLLADELRGLLRQAREENRRVLRKDLQLVHDERLLTVDLEAAPVTGRGNLLLVTFEAKAPPSPSSDQQQADSRLALLERDLIATRQDLQATIEELETANEELQSANEELQANNEELQATNEELETSREELQATNEELETVNAELKRKNDKLLRAQDDVNNLFAGANIGTVILDPELRIKRFTPVAAGVFKLIDTDIGRPLTDIASTLRYDRFEEDVREVLESLAKKEQEVTTRDGRWFSLHLQPYRTSDRMIAGVVVTLSNVTRLKETEIVARKAQEFAESILTAMREPLLVLGADLRVVRANRAFYEMFRVSPKVTEGVPIFQLGNNQWDIPDLRRLLVEIIPANTEFRDFEVRHAFPSIGERTMLLNAHRLDREEGHPDLILLVFEDVTQTDNAKKGDDLDG